MKNRVRFCLLVAFVVFFSRHMIGGNGTGAVPAGQVAWQLVGKSLLNLETGMGQVLGYFTYLNGVPGPMFAGPPGESTAFFTLRSEPFSLETFPNGNILIGLLGPEMFRVYLDTTPDQAFEDPASFSDGQTLATLDRLPAQLNFVGPVFVDTFSARLVSARNFFWQDRQLNIRRLTPGGVTVHVAGSTEFLPSGVADFPVSVSFGASGVAIGRPETDDND